VIRIFFKITLIACERDSRSRASFALPVLGCPSSGVATDFDTREITVARQSEPAPMPQSGARVGLDGCGRGRVSVPVVRRMWRGTNRF
jgi:hypothetical protein